MGARDLRSRLLRRASRANISLPRETSDHLCAYFDLLARWNRKINLTSLEDPDSAIDRLLLEPVVAARHVPSAGKLMDVGSGGGSPAIPMKLMVPDVQLIMVEAKARKAAFLREAVRQLNLADTRVEEARYETLLTRPELHEALNAVSLRAVRVEAKVLLTLQAFLATGGVVLLFRGPAGPAAPGVVVPPLQWSGTFPLLDRLQSRLSILTKRDVGGL